MHRIYRYFSSKARLRLSTGEIFNGYSCGAEKATSGEVVFTTSMVGYLESMTDPSYKGQILAFTQPLIGNYGVPSFNERDEFGLLKHFESEKIHPSGIIVGDVADRISHWQGKISISEWCKSESIPLVTGIDTRSLVKILRSRGSTFGAVEIENSAPVCLDQAIDPNRINLVSQVSVSKTEIYNRGGRRKIALIDCGAKQNIIRCLSELNCEVHLVPFNYDVSKDLTFNGIFISNGPGSPELCGETVDVITKLLKQNRPIFGICMGNLLIGKAAGFKVRKLPFGNRSHNQAVINLEDGKCYITSQNHGYALLDSPQDIPDGWKVLYRNLHDGSNEGIAHQEKPIKAVQFHPEAKGGPLDTLGFFTEFVNEVDKYIVINRG